MANTTPRPGRQRRRRAAAGAWRVTSPRGFDLQRFAHVDNLHVAYRLLEQEGGHGAGSDGLTFKDFSTKELFQALRAVSNALTSRTYRPYETRTVRIAKGDGRFRELKLQRLMDRTAAKALQLAVAPYLYEHVTGTPQDVWGIYADLQARIRQDKTYVIATDDIRDCFPSAPLESVLDCFEEYTPQPDLLWLIECVVRGHKPPTQQTGLDQGSPFSPVAMELLLHQRLDVPLHRKCPGSPLLRYVDNLTFVCSSAREGQDLLRHTGQILNKAGFCLKTEDDPPADLRNNPRNVLGLSVRWENGQLKFTIPQDAYEDLQKGFQHALTHQRPTEAAQAVARGWISAVGPALTNATRPAIVNRVMETAREYGLRSLNRDLQNHAQQARLRWLEKSGQRPTAGGRRR